jgi:ferric-dicitrate binding protein FerR (iron transport regulator)
VTLNKHSSLAYPAVFNGDKRQVTLKGEGFFAITPDKTKPFSIDANNTTVTVVGTTFNVKTTENRTEVIVETGIVEVARQTNKVRIIHNQKAIVTGNSAPIAESNNDGLYTYYRSGEFICNNTPLFKLVNILNEAYNVQISFSDEELGARVINTTFHNEPIDEIVDVICQTFNLKAVKNGKNIVLSAR